MNEPQRCPKCSGEMEEGFTLDISHGARFAARWVEGKPERTFWLGIKTSGRVQREIDTFRCRDCGYLESYARRPHQRPI